MKLVLCSWESPFANCLADVPDGDYFSRAIVQSGGAPTADTTYMGLTSCSRITIAETVARPVRDTQPAPLVGSARSRRGLRSHALATECLQSASIFVMATLYIREVPDPVVDTLKERAAAQGQSLSAYVGAELATLAARPTNREIATRLRAKDRANGPSVDDIVAAVEAGRR